MTASPANGLRRDRAVVPLSLSHCSGHVSYGSEARYVNFNARTLAAAVPGR